jgi:hypothetical protein
VGGINFDKVTQGLHMTPIVVACIGVDPQAQAHALGLCHLVSWRDLNLGGGYISNPLPQTRQATIDTFASFENHFRNCRI